MDTAQFLTELYGEVQQGALEITLIAPKELKIKPKTIVRWKPLPLTFQDPNFTALHASNNKGYGIYFGLAPRREKKPGEWRVRKDTGEKYWMGNPRGNQGDAQSLTALWVETDAHAGEDLDDAFKRIKQLNPSIIVASGAGYHGYFLLDNPLELTDDNRPAVKSLLKGLAKSVNGDPHVAELARVFRLPGTVNTKPERQNALCEVIDFASRRYAYNDLFERYAPLVPERKPVSQPTVITQEARSEVEQALSFLPAAQLPYDQWFTILAGLTHSLGTTEAERLAERWSGWCSEPGEIADKIASIDDNGASVATIGSVFHLAKSYGYEPPKRTSSAMSVENKLAISSHMAQFSAGGGK